MPEETTLVTEAATQADAAPAATTPDATAQESTPSGDTETTLLGGDTETQEGGEQSQDKEGTGNVPEKYEFKLPEGVELDSTLLDKMSPIFKEIGLSQENAQKLVDAYAPYVKQQMEAHQEEAIEYFKDMVQEWKKETQAELGAMAPKKLAVAAKAINRFGSPALRELFNETGVGNHKEMVNFLIKVGQSISEDSFAEPNKQTGFNLDDPKMLYPTMKE